jgi:hypothetical protein
VYGIEAGADAVVDTREPAQVDVTFDVHFHLIELDPELGCPGLIDDHLAGT